MCDLETVESHEISIFLKCIGADLSMLEGLFNFLFYYGVNQYAGQKT